MLWNIVCSITINFLLHINLVCCQQLLEDTNIFVQSTANANVNATINPIVLS
jgi:hypothetical protein